MDNIDETKRKPRRTFGTPSYHYRNRFAVLVILAGSGIFGLWACTPIFKASNEKMMRDVLKVSDEEKARKLTFNLHAAPRTSRSIQATLDERDQLISER